MDFVTGLTADELLDEASEVVAENLDDGFVIDEVKSEHNIGERELTIRFTNE